MQFRTIVDIPASAWRIEPCERMLFVGSCFADNIGKRFRDEKFRAVVNPYGVMYNPASVLHTVERVVQEQGRGFRTVVVTLGTNHVYRLKETGQIVDNCQKRPQNLFVEEELTVDDCYHYLRQAVELLQAHVVLTVSPIRYRKYGYHESQLSKATLLLAADRLARDFDCVEYFPAYEIVNDELRDYRFYQPDMLHPSQQAVDYIYERFAATYFAAATHEFLQQWRPILQALAHRPFDAESEAYQNFLAATQQKLEALRQRYPQMEMPET